MREKDNQTKSQPQFLAIPLLVLWLILMATIAVVNSPPLSAEEIRVAICHHTGLESNPYVDITIDMSALPAHLDHGDIYPVPPSGCPSGVTPTNIPTATFTTIPTVTPTSPNTPMPTNTSTNTPTETATSTPTDTPGPTQTEPPDPGPDGNNPGIADRYARTDAEAACGT